MKHDYDNGNGDKMSHHSHDPEVSYMAVEVCEQMFFNSAEGKRYKPMYQQLKQEEYEHKKRMEKFQKDYQEQFKAFMSDTYHGHM